MKAVFRWSLWQSRWSTIWWLVGITAFVALQLAFYPTIRDQQAELEKSFSQLSDSAIALFSDTGDFFSPVGYLSGQIFYLMMPLLLGILAIGLGASLVGREEREGTLELLLARPISRSKLILSKAAVGILIVFIVGLLGTVVTAIMSKLVNLPVPLDNIMLAGLASVGLSLSFGAVAFMITTLGRGARAAAIGVAALFAIAGYLLSSLAATVDWLKWPAKALPFEYYQPAAILEDNYNWMNILFVIGVVLVSGLVSWIAFRRRDIST
jgi:ABC-2 type transport system permease protein